MRNKIVYNPVLSHVNWHYHRWWGGGEVQACGDVDAGVAFILASLTVRLQGDTGLTWAETRPEGHLRLLRTSVKTAQKQGWTSPWKDQGVSWTEHCNACVYHLVFISGCFPSFINSHLGMWSFCLSERLYPTGFQFRKTLGSDPSSIAYHCVTLVNLINVLTVKWR